MRNFQEKRGASQIFLSWPFLFLFGLLLLFFAWGVVGLLGKMENTRKNKNIAEDKVRELARTKEKLSLDIVALDTDKGKEASIREKFGLAKEGEKLIIVVDEKSEIPAQKEDNGFFSFFRNWFK
ncbi:MAG: septum formation initiator family protein [Candidatus Pacebacteria bacterium]|jgi:cell division protein FtsB|nr:septum formation initiator family protein [Candidatus Paceibacterota bacterium]